MGMPSRGHGTAATDSDWTRAIERVLAEPELVRPVFQPIVDLDRGVACGYEMLARFVSPIKASPLAWLAEAERRGLDTQLEAMLVEAGLDALGWLPDGCFLTINVSPRALGSEHVAALLAARESLEGVVIEVTEQAVVEDYDDLEFVLRSLRAAGAAVGRRGARAGPGGRLAPRGGRGDGLDEPGAGVREPAPHRGAAAAVREARPLARRGPRP